MGRGNAGHPRWTMLVPRIDVFGVKPGLILCLRGYLNLEFRLLGGFEVVSKIGGLVESLEGATRVGLLKLMMARSAVWMREWMGN